MSVQHWGSQIEHFYRLTPDVVFKNLEHLGFKPTGNISQLNSLENRVYDVEVGETPHQLESVFAQKRIILKYYRPGRWAHSTLKEEHQFYLEMKGYELPVVAPIAVNDETLFYDAETQLHWCIFPKILGRIKDEFSINESQQLGRLIARVHNIGKLGTFNARPTYEPEAYFQAAVEQNNKSHFFPDDLKAHYQSLLQILKPYITEIFKTTNKQRIHGDFHRGNVIWTHDGLWLTDLDDCMTAPVEQDLWLFFSGQDPYLVERRNNFLSAYEEMSRSKVHLSRKKIEALRAMRLINFNLWIDLRYDDPFFKKMFPHFESRSFFEQHLLDLKEALSLLTTEETEYQF